MIAIRDADDGETILINEGSVDYACQFGDMVVLSVGGVQFYTKTFDMDGLCAILGADRRDFDEQAAATET